MGTEGIEHVIFPPRKRTPIERRTILLGSLIIVLVFSSFTLGLTSLLNHSAHSNHSVGNRARIGSSNASKTSVASSTTGQPTPFPPPTPPPIPPQSPLSPFPSFLPAQVALLQAKDRFFYHGNTKLPEIALTFDDGPNPLYTAQILAILERYHVKATFFCIGRQVQAYPALVKQEYGSGYLVENHSWSHAYLPNLSDASLLWQFTTTQNIIEHTIGIRPTYFRPPYGAFNAPVLTNANRFGLSTVLWNVDPRDWSRPGVNAIVARIIAQTMNGSIILMHDGGGDRSQTVAALPFVITWFLQRGYRFATLQQLVADYHLDDTSASSQKSNVPFSSQEWWRRKLQMIYNL